MIKIYDDADDLLKFDNHFEAVSFVMYESTYSFGDEYSASIIRSILKGVMEDFMSMYASNPSASNYATVQQYMQVYQNAVNNVRTK